ncbi:MAG: protein kinase [Myxococcales bacterium]|nr:protein kinase [Myxococcales bacterium]
MLPPGYRFDGVLREGGVGAVARCIDLSDGAAVAIKRLGRLDPVRLARWSREVAALARCTSPAVVPLKAHGSLDDGPWCAFPWVEGGSLADRLSEGPLGPQEVVALARRLTLALGAIHRAGVVHRDLKPANILLPGGDVSAALVTDFGLARGADAAAVTDTRAVVGTPAYLSPEVARGLDAGPASDVFALGVVLYEAAAGKNPFFADSVLAAVARVMLLRPPPLDAVVPGFPRRLAAQIARLLEVNERERPTDGDAARALFVDDTLADPAPGPDTLWQLERWPATALVMRLDAHGAPSEATLTGDGPAADLSDAIRQLSDADARVISLSPTALAAVWTHLGGTHRARLAAHAALTLAARFPAAQLGLGTGTARLDHPTPHGDPLGDALDAALARLGAGSVRLDAATEALLGGRFVCAPEGPDSFRLVRAQPHPDSGETEALGSLTPPFLGRERALSALTDAVAEARDEGPRVEVVLGPPGMGKTRLAEAFVARCEGRPGHCVWVLRADPLTAAVPLALVGQGLRDARAAQNPESQSADPRGSVDSASNTARSAALASLAEGRGEGLDGDPAVRRERHEAALGWWLARHAEGRTLVLVVDDLQWADGPSLACLGAGLGRLDTPWVAVLFGRPESAVSEALAVLPSRNTRQVSLGPLAPRAIAPWLTEVLGAARAESLAPRFVELSEGNPLFLRELARALAEGRPLGATPTIRTLLQARCAALDPLQRRTLRVAAVLGRRFAQAALEALLAMPLGEVLQGLSRRDWLQRELDGDAAAPWWRFRHDLLCDAAYDLVPPEERQRAHASALAWLESAPDTPPRVRLAQAERAHDPRAIATHAFAAACAAFEANDIVDAAKLVEVGLSAAPSPELTVELLAVQVVTSFYLGRFHDVRAVAAQLLSPHARPSRWVCRALGHVGAMGMHLGLGFVGLSQIESLLARPELPAEDLVEALAMSLNGLSLALETRAAAASAARLAQLREQGALESPTTLGWVAHALAWHSLLVGDPEAAEREATRAIAQFERGRDRRNTVASYALRGQTRLGLGRPDALDDARAACALGDAIGAGFAPLYARILSALVESAAPNGDLDRAQAQAEFVAAALGQSPVMRGWAGLALATVAARRGRPEEALAKALDAYGCASFVPYNAQLLAVALQNVDSASTSYPWLRSEARRVLALAPTFLGRDGLAAALAARPGRDDED